MAETQNVAQVVFAQWVTVDARGEKISACICIPAAPLVMPPLSSLPVLPKRKRGKRRQFRAKPNRCIGLRRYGVSGLAAKNEKGKYTRAAEQFDADWRAASLPLMTACESSSSSLAQGHCRRSHLAHRGGSAQLVRKDVGYASKWRVIGFI